MLRARSSPRRRPTRVKFQWLGVVQGSLALSAASRMARKKQQTPAACSWRLYSLPPSFNHSSSAPSLVLTLSPPSSTTSTTSTPIPSGPAAEQRLIWCAHNNSCSRLVFSNHHCTSSFKVQAWTWVWAPSFRPGSMFRPKLQVWARVQAPGIPGLMSWGSGLGILALSTGCF